jgi:hypothetical protein
VQTEKQGKKMKHESQKRQSRPDSSTLESLEVIYRAKARKTARSESTLKPQKNNKMEKIIGSTCCARMWWWLAGHCVVLCGAATLVTLYPQTS